MSNPDETKPQGTPQAAPATPTPAPKYTLTGDTLEELSVAFGEVLAKSGQLIVKDNKSGNGSKYGTWALDDGMSDNPFSKGLGLTPEQARRMPTAAGVPAIMSVEVFLRQLSPASAIAAKAAERAAVTANRESALEAKLNAIRARRGEGPVK